MQIVIVAEGDDIDGFVERAALRTMGWMSCGAAIDSIQCNFAVIASAASLCDDRWYFEEYKCRQSR